jgi:hypothetical protein
MVVDMVVGMVEGSLVVLVVGMVVDMVVGSLVVLVGL